MIMDYINSGKTSFHFSSEKDLNGHWIEGDFEKILFKEIELINSTSTKWKIEEQPYEIRFEDKPIHFRVFKFIKK